MLKGFGTDFSTDSQQIFSGFGMASRLSFIAAADRDFSYVLELILTRNKLVSRLFLCRLQQACEALY